MREKVQRIEHFKVSGNRSFGGQSPPLLEGQRLGVSLSTVSEYEEREQKGTITFNSLRKAAEGLGCRLRYVLVPEESSLKELREKAARKAAARMVEKTSRSMVLEDQKVPKPAGVAVKL